jgi:hypothetical protein
MAFAPKQAKTSFQPRAQNGSWFFVVCFLSADLADQADFESAYSKKSAKSVQSADKKKSNTV